jgi:hypothetical protein
MRLCRRCKRKEAPSYHDWCQPCHTARRNEREAARRRADPQRASWVRDWNRLRMRQYRGHEMREEPCRECGTEKATVMLLKQNPLKWTVVCRRCRARKYPDRDVTGRQKKARTEALIRRRLRPAMEDVGL